MGIAGYKRCIIIQWEWLHQNDIYDGYAKKSTKGVKEIWQKNKIALCLLYQAVDESGFEKIIGAIPSKEP